MPWIGLAAALAQSDTLTPPEARAYHRRQVSDEDESRSRAVTTAVSNKTQTYGYHNTFHFHAQPAVTAAPPSYERATSRCTLQTSVSATKSHDNVLPGYSCTVHQEGVLGMKGELASPFTFCSDDRWNECYAVLSGTQLHVHRLKTASGILHRNRAPCAGRLVKTYTLQHAEVGLASDVKRSELVPKSPFAKLVPPGARQKVYETDPHLFEPVREFIFRLRIEGSQFLLCASTQEEMLDWVEKL
ncbi:hypothetical protein LTS18_009447, partial [Coniosporium uncinatum]